MHILFLSHYFTPEGNAPASRTYENCKQWVHSGHKVTVVTGVPNVPDGVIYDGYKNKVRQWEDIAGIQVLRVWTYIAPNRGFFKRTLNYLSFMFSSLQGMFVNEVDVVVATSPQFFCAVGGYILSLLKRVPFIMEVRDLWPESIKTVGAIKDNKIIRILERLEVYLYKKADHIVALTESFKKNIIGKGIPAAKITVIKNGVDTEFFKPAIKSETAKKALGFDGKFIVLYIGTLGMAHALDRILAVAERMKDIKDILFLFVGSGAEKENLLKIKNEKALGNVTFIGRQPKESTPGFYECSDICLVPLRKASLFKTVLPSKIFEIMAMGKPIIQSVDGEARQILEESRAGIYVEPEDEKAIYDAVLHLYNNTNEVQLLGQNGRIFVEKNFKRNDLADQYFTIIESIV
jgi:glycosyltransferase involved in cell wall biosynthesis